jgi:two-component system nitrogen regulation response regulator NtrX
MDAGLNSATIFDERLVRPVTRHLVIVDDDPSVVRMLKENLELEGYNVQCAFEGDAALRLIRQGPCNLVILDVNMPLTNGLQVLYHLRARPETARIPVIFISGEPSGDIYPCVARDPRAAHIKKPLDLETFNTIVRYFLERYPYP